MCVLASLGVTWCDTPYFLAYPHVSSRAVPLLGFLGFFGVSQSYSCVGVDRHDDYSADSSAGLALCGFIGVFSEFRVCSDRILTCRIKSIRSPAKVGLVVTDLITSPVVSWEGWETPPPPSTAALLSFFAQPPAW